MLTQKIVYNATISILSKIVNIAFGLTIIGLTTRYLGQSGFGDYSTILAFLFVFMILSDLGLYSIGVREISKEGADERKIMNNIFTMKFLSSFLIFIAAFLIGWLLPYSYQIKLGILIATLGYWSMSNMQVLMGVFQKYLRMDKVALADVASRALQLGLVLFFIKKDLGFLSIIWGFSLTALFNFVLVFFLARRYIVLKFEFDSMLWKKTLAQGYPLAISIILTTFYFKLNTVLLSLMKSNVEVGIFSLSYRILENLIFFPAMFLGLMMPLMSKYIFSDQGIFRKIIQKTFDILLIMAMPLILSVLFLSEPIIQLLGGNDFLASAPVLNILIFATAIIFLSTLFYNMIVVLDKQKSLIWIYGIGAVSSIAGNLIFIPKYSYYAVAVNTVAVELLVTLLMAVIIFRSLRYLPSFKIAGRILGASLMMTMTLYWLSAWPLLPLLIISALIYLVFLYFFKGITRADISMLLQKPTIKDLF